MTTPDLIGLSGKAQCGKGTVAGMLRAVGFIQVSFADSVRTAAWTLNPLLARGVTYRDAIEDLGYEQAKRRYPEFRRVLQSMGTEVGRDLIGENVWADMLLNRRIEGSRYVIDDVRFPNEAEAVLASRGLLIRIDRNNAGLKGTAGLHPSEIALDDYPFTHRIDNNGSLATLRLAVTNLVNL